jgi:hypothetical protein
MDYGKPSPFELWRRENLNNTAVSKEVLELIAKAFEDGQLSEREWVGLTAKDLAEIPPSCYEGAIWADAKLREKNT